MSEIATKLKNLRHAMENENISGLRLRGVDWFAWATGGGNSTVIFTSEVGIAEVFITAHHAWILTDTIEKERLFTEEISEDYEIKAFPWQQKKAADEFVAAELKGRKCCSDRPTAGEHALPEPCQRLKLILSPEEIGRYRSLGRLAAEAMTEALQNAEPDWSEDRLAGEGARALWSRGLDPTLVLVGNERRTRLYRHAVAGPEKLGGCAMMVFCARAFGLYANLTRFVYFRDPTPEEERSFKTVAQVEAAAFRHSLEGESMAHVYECISEAYAKAEHPEEIHRHHQGGTTGYLSREWVATPHSPAHWKLQNNMALAWNPSLPGAKIEDTVLMTSEELEILTVDPEWPTFQQDRLLRPDIWVKS